MPGALFIAGPLLAEIGISASAVAAIILLARIAIFCYKFLKRGL